MAGWTKYFRPVNSALPAQSSGLAPHATSVSRFSSWLPEFYQGPPNRLMRYMQYEQMDLDHEVAAALDTIADFSTHLDDNSNLPFEIEYHEEASPSEKEILTRTLRNWCNLNDFQRRIFRIFRSTLVYGDQFFIRDPQTYELYWVDPSTVEKVLVNESKGKEIEVYYVKDLDLNLQASVATNVTRKTEMGYNAQDTIFPNAPYTGQANYATGSASPHLSAQGGLDSRQQAFPVDAAHVVHLSLSEGMNNSWPFGISVLESVFKVYKQKELLEDSILIYRVHRAPERRIFKIDVGTMPPNKAAEYLNRVRYEVQQKRIPSRTGGGQSIVDSAYNPMCLSLETKIPLLDGRTLSLDEIIKERNAGKENWIYSCDPITGKVVPGNITWAGITRRNAETVKLTLDNDETIICTPDHKIPVLGKGFVEAGKLTVNDTLISFETRQKSLSNDEQRSYEQVYDHELNDWVFTHRMVAEFFRDLGKHQTLVFDESLQNEEKNVVHHKDFKKKTSVYNHRIKSIEKAEQQDVGTITVDFEERWHNYHTFALAAGIFVKNSMLEDYFFAVTADGRGSDVDTLPGGENLGQIDDLKYFNNKMMRGLGVPSGYLPTGPEDGSNTYNDGRVGSAFIQEFRFSRVCQRYQRLLVDKLDKEFKLYLKFRGIEIDPAIFAIKFLPPQNFSEWRQLEIDGTRANLFAQLKDVPYLSKRFAMKRYLGLTEDDLDENERLWREENGRRHLTQDEGAVADMRGVGIAPPTGDFDLEMGDMEGEPGGEMGEVPGAEPAPPTPGGESPPQI